MKTKFRLMVFFVICWFFSTLNHAYAQRATSQELPNTIFCEINATIVDNDSSCQVEWSNLWYWYWDDGSCEEYLAWMGPDGEVVNKFELSGGPVQIVGGEIYVGDGSFPNGGSFLGTDFLLVAYDNDGENGMPGTLVDSVVITVENYEWVRCEGLNAFDEDGVFYLGMRQLLYPPNVAPTGVDNDLPSMNNSYIRQPFTGQWLVPSNQDFMIRAFTCNASKQVSSSLPNDYANIVVSRISDFNPAQGETPEDGVLTVIDSVVGMPALYFDTTMVSLPDGYYAYGLKRLTNGDSTYSDWSYSNAVYHILTSIEDVISKEIFSVYPNPTHAKVVVRAEAGVNNTIQVTDIIGRIVFRSDLPLSGEMSIYVSGWPKGLYFVSLTNSGMRNKAIKLVVD
ncbi:MAG: T9SS type A sorting domain-containing protein [Bacteroidales bacterium]|nr:T9SS type A sorting domain-containing protein [Bacteroidales bacterium]